MKQTAVSIAAASVLAMMYPATSAADPSAHLKSEIDAARSESGCPPLQLDPILSIVSQRVLGETDSYIKHAPTARALPTTGEIDLIPTGRGGVLRVMRESGYNTNKAKLLAGYADYRTGSGGENGPAGYEDDAIKGLVLQAKGFQVLADCKFTRYGLSAVNDDGSQGWPSVAPRTFSLVIAVVAGDPGRS